MNLRALPAHAAEPASGREGRGNAARGTAFEQLQATADASRAVAGLRALQRAASAGAAPRAGMLPVAQLAAWTDAETALGGLSPELKACVLLVRATPTAAPALPDWVEARVRADNQRDVDKKRVEYAAAAQNKWDGLPLQARAKNDETTWKAQWVDKQMHAVIQGYETQVPGQVGARGGEYKWNADFNNDDGFLPGIKGAGGYSEYYAEPDPGAGFADGFWGQNRVVREKTGLGAAANALFATDDHYNNFVKVKGA